ncbi:MAG: tRNA dihydrouridine(20/20a) synthase DusA [Hyphomicrobiales bacterium]|nr:tRNA dihydrouridine(20/20a) synthase DusA [Hyphomicrobiales bacterium]
MMDWTDRHCRVFHRHLTRHALLYTEMVTAQAIRHGHRQLLLGFDALEQPVALQLGGSDPGLLSDAARIGEDFGYCEINLNVGCPSDRVQEGRFGACLMAEPKLVADCVAAMRSTVKIPVTVKCRIGIDDQDEVEGLDRFVEAVSETGCDTFIIHARKAWLKGLSPKENREIPPLNYPRVHQMKADFPHLNIILNGGLATLGQAIDEMRGLDGVMLGRAAYHTPWLLADVDRLFFQKTNPLTSRIDAVTGMLPYIEEQLRRGDFLAKISRHLLGLFHGQPGGRHWRQIISEQSHLPGAGIDVLRRGLDAVELQSNRLLAAE